MDVDLFSTLHIFTGAPLMNLHGYTVYPTSLIYTHLTYLSFVTIQLNKQPQCMLWGLYAIDQNKVVYICEVEGL